MDIDSVQCHTQNLCDHHEHFNTGFDFLSKWLFRKEKHVQIFGELLQIY